jgi:hypothetical protein
MTHFRLLSERNNKKSEWFTNFLYEAMPTPGPRDPENRYGGEPGTPPENYTMQEIEIHFCSLFRLLSSRLLVLATKHNIGTHGQQCN